MPRFGPATCDAGYPFQSTSTHPNPTAEAAVARVQGAGYGLRRMSGERLYSLFQTSRGRYPFSVDEMTTIRAYLVEVNRFDARVFGSKAEFVELGGIL